MWPYDQNQNPYTQQVQNLLASQLQPNTPAQQASIHTPKVNGRNGAEAFNLPPNSDTLLLDMNEAIIWCIQTDSAGYKIVVPYDISPHKEQKTEDRFKSFEDRLSRLEEAVANGKPNNSGSNFKQQQHNDAGNRSNDKR